MILREIDRILFQDESMIRDYQALAHTWFPRGQQKIVPTYGKHRGVKLIGILDYESGEIFCIEEEQYDANVFLAFLKQVVARYPGEKIVMVLDNARIHHAKLIKPFLKEHSDRLQLMFLPPYSPQHVFYHTVAEIRTAVQNFISKINKTPMETVDRLCIQL